MTEPTAGYVLTPEPPSGPLTARNLEDFAQCPRKYLLSFFSTRARTQQFIGGPAALHRAVRSALLEMYATGGPGAYALDKMVEAFEESWDGSACKDSKEEEDLHRDGVLMLQRHAQRPLQLGGPGSSAASEPHSTGREPARATKSVEVQTDLRLEGDIGGHLLVAVADLAVPDPPRVVRFTTSRRPPSPGELPKDLSWGLLYLLGLRHFEDEDLVCVMADLRKGREIEFALDAAQCSRLEARISGLADRIRQEREFPAVTGKQCRWCRSRRECPAWRKQ